jgi:hypothetical protein
MKKFLLAVITIALLAASVVVPTSANAASNYDRFIKYMHANSEGAHYENHKDMWELGKSICAMFRYGGTVEDVIDVAIEAGVDDTEFVAAEITGAVRYICPRERHEVTAFMNRESSYA